MQVNYLQNNVVNVAYAFQMAYFERIDDDLSQLYKPQ